MTETEHHAGVKCSSESLSLSVCVCVCVSARSKTAETIQSPNLPQGYSIMNRGYSFNIRLKGQGHRVTKCKTCFRRSSGRREFALYRVTGVYISFIQFIIFYAISAAEQLSSG